MPQPVKIWKEIWRKQLQAHFGNRLRGEQLEAAVAECEVLRGLWEPLLTLAPGQIDNESIPDYPPSQPNGGKRG